MKATLLLECVGLLGVNCVLAVFYFSAVVSVMKSSVSPGAYDASDSFTYLATAVPFLLASIVINFAFAIWAIYLAVKRKVFLRLILLVFIGIAWLGGHLILRS
jgi:hypothetical protein